MLSVLNQIALELAPIPSQGSKACGGISGIYPLNTPAQFDLWRGNMCYLRPREKE
jgi:hypothetical protein